MPYKVTLGNPSRTTRRRPESDPKDGSGTGGKLDMSRLTYQALSSLVQNKKLLELYDNNRLPLEYRRVLDELNDLYLRNNYGSSGANIVIKDGIIALDEYLGTLGIGIDYPYSKDATNVDEWIYNSVQTEYRILVDGSDNTYLTTNNGTEVLVIYT